MREEAEIASDTIFVEKRVDSAFKVPKMNEVRARLGRPRKRFSRGRFAAAVLLTATLAIGILIGTVVSDKAGAARTLWIEGAMRLGLPVAIPSSTTFAEIARRTEPAVVNISTTQVIDRRGFARPRGRTEDPFQDFFNRFFDAPEEGPEAERSLGSGMVVDPRGLILTNYHVVGLATKIQVQIAGDPTTYTARLIGTDEETDLAVIRIDVPRPLSALKLGNSDGVQVGDWVLAIGSPFGLEATVTAGIVSAKDRSVGQQFQRFLQTDAAINPGNSGGPLVDMAGQVIGVNTAILTGGRGYEGVGFALPSNTAISVYNQIIEHGKVTRGSIGVSFHEAHSRNPIVLRDLGGTHGIILEAIEPGGPAARAGIEPGDLIVSVNGNPVRSGPDMVNPIAETPLGGQVLVGYLRDRRMREATVTVDDRAKLFPDRASSAPRATRPRTEPAGPAEMGLRIEELEATQARRPRAYPNRQGVIVADVAPASFGEDIDFLPGDLITQINRMDVASVADYRRAVAAMKPGAEMVFRILREEDGGRILTIFLAGVVPPAER
jgi:serine protease Do